MGKRKAQMERIVKRVLSGLGRIRVDVPRRGQNTRITLQLNEPQLILPHVTALKEQLGPFKLTTRWAGKIEGVGFVSMQLTYPHSNRPLLVVPKHPVDLPYPLSNSSSPHEIKGKYFVVSKEALEHPHDNIEVRLTIRANSTTTRHITDLDLVGLKNGHAVLLEVLNGRTSDIKAALLRKSEVWAALRSVGIPLDKLLVYTVVRVPSIFKRDHLAEILDILRKKGFSGKLFLTNTYHSKHEEFTF